MLKVFGGLVFFDFNSAHQQTYINTPPLLWTPKILCVFLWTKPIYLFSFSNICSVHLMSAVSQATQQKLLLRHRKTSWTWHQLVTLPLLCQSWICHPVLRHSRPKSSSGHFTVWALLHRSKIIVKIKLLCVCVFVRACDTSTCKLCLCIWKKYPTGAGLIFSLQFRTNVWW